MALCSMHDTLRWVANRCVHTEYTTSEWPRGGLVGWAELGFDAPDQGFGQANKNPLASKTPTVYVEQIGRILTTDTRQKFADEREVQADGKWFGKIIPRCLGQGPRLGVNFVAWLHLLPAHRGVGTCKWVCTGGSASRFKGWARRDQDSQCHKNCVDNI